MALAIFLAVLLAGPFALVNLDVLKLRSLRRGELLRCLEGGILVGKSDLIHLKNQWHLHSFPRVGFWCLLCQLLYPTT